MGHVSISRRRPRELGTTVGAAGLLGRTRLLTLMAEEVAKSRELSPVAAMFPALWLGPAVDDSNLLARIRGGAHPQFRGDLSCAVEAHGRLVRGG